jgi:hypothetical protein
MTNDQVIELAARLREAGLQGQYNNATDAARFVRAGIAAEGGVLTETLAISYKLIGALEVAEAAHHRYEALYLDADGLPYNAAREWSTFYASVALAHLEA